LVVIARLLTQDKYIAQSFFLFAKFLHVGAGMLKFKWQSGTFF